MYVCVKQHWTGLADIIATTTTLHLQTWLVITGLTKQRTRKNIRMSESGAARTQRTKNIWGHFPKCLEHTGHADTLSQKGMDSGLRLGLGLFGVQCGHFQRSGPVWCFVGPVMAAYRLGAAHAKVSSQMIQHTNLSQHKNANTRNTKSNTLKYNQAT